MKLHFQRLGQGKPLVILHGLFGSLENWGLQARALSERFDVIAVDLRNHGRSPHSPGMTYADMSADLKALLDSLELDRVLLMGHSMGGKVAMQFALDHPERVEKLVVVDIAPVHYPPHHDDVIQGLKAIPLTTLKSRREADQVLARYVDSEPTRAFLLKNLYRNDARQFAWRMNLDTLAEDYSDISAAPDSANTHYGGPTLFIKGGESDYLKPEHQRPIETLFPQAKFKIIAGAGHLPHVEKPAAFTKLVETFFTPAD
ncbi:alpha/beta fold hydrolase [Marinobacterium sp. AK62]|uniref:Alpha/beta fold hydrolase n=1 Tax=Marinobacterium alkalitolerans TaxID=1542925 RepID=A0ABS3ZAY7_9GAMM|nr:alpha/beta fold hydrolase [Marinobacterium alkalitolerans]MBP0048463.1 alpha/beta fold hydrolase [Marinobacterium alkalitolerans]